MEQFTQFLKAYGFLALLAGLGLLAAGTILAVRARQGRWSRGLLFCLAFLVLLAAGGAWVPVDWGVWIALASVVAFAGMAAVLLVSERWWAPLGYILGAALVIGIGGTLGRGVSHGSAELAKLIHSLTPAQPIWLCLLLLVQLVFLFGYRSLGLERIGHRGGKASLGRGWRTALALPTLVLLGPVPAYFLLFCRSSLTWPEFTRRWLTVGLRAAVVVFLSLALADLRISHPNDAVTVLFLWDRSLSVPEEYDSSTTQTPVDLRFERLKRFVNESVRLRGDGHERDKAGVIVFGKQPNLELPPSDAPRMNFTKFDSLVDPNSTDLGGAIKLALASFPEGSGKRIVLMSDGNENLGNAEEQARLSKLNGVQIDVVPLAANERKENEVMVQAVEALPQVEESSVLNIRVLIRNMNPKPVVGILRLMQTSEGKSVLVGDPSRLIKLEPGLNAIPYKHRLERQRQSYTFSAKFEPKGVETAPDQIKMGLPGDRWQNNVASTHVVALGQRRILLLEEPGTDNASGQRHEFLYRQLRAAGRDKYRLDVLSVDRLFTTKDELGVFLSNYDCVIMADVPADWFTDAQMEMIRSNTHDQGCGLIMIGGPKSFGAGGWQSTPVEKALPVDCEIKALKIEGKGGLVLIMHASELADGNRWQKEIAKLAIKKLSNVDEVGVMQWDGVPPTLMKWVIDLSPIQNENNRKAMLAKVDGMAPGDMPEFDSGLRLAHKALMDPTKNLATRHVIIISDGDPGLGNAQFLRKMKDDRVTVTTVGVATHGVTEDQKMKTIAEITGGRVHSVKNPSELPAIYLKEIRIVSRSFVAENRFQPNLRYTQGGPTESIAEQLPPLYGYVRTTAKPSLLVDVPIETPTAEKFPILAHWQYGLGRAVAFMSDARSLPPTKAHWDREWASSELYAKFWDKIVDWSLRPVETGQLTMYTQIRDGKVKVIVDTRDSKQPLDEGDIVLEGSVTPPSDQPREAAQIRFERKSADVYEAEFKAEDAGSYFVNAHLKRRVKGTKDGKETWTDEFLDSVRSGVTVPYALEFADLESNAPLLEKLRQITGGETYADNDQALDEAARAGTVFRPTQVRTPTLQPIWFWLVLLAACCLFFDVAIRRIAVDPHEVAEASKRLWEKLRGHPDKAPKAPEFFERLHSRKAQVGESLELTKAARKFESSETATTAAPLSSATIESAPSAPKAPPPPKMEIAPEKEKPADDFASRLMRAKKRVWEERDEDKGPT